METVRPERELDWIILSDGELNRRARRLTVIGILVVLVFSALGLWSVASNPVASTQAGAGPMRIPVARQSAAAHPKSASQEVSAHASADKSAAAGSTSAPATVTQAEAAALAARPIPPNPWTYRAAVKRVTAPAPSGTYDL